MEASKRPSWTFCLRFEGMDVSELSSPVSFFSLEIKAFFPHILPLVYEFIFVMLPIGTLIFLANNYKVDA